ncbi:MAG TPA: hemerythrin domain-containing protein [Chromatiales bacterium]|nr:hemerythrin domain-containing protein [Chromatiales bacterium]HEX23203.1 hemerythrin domain-containing protein [Chromatiales bacterium]
MSVFSKWFGKKPAYREESTSDAEAIFAPNTSIPYRTTLIDDLKSDHQQLGVVFGELVAAASTGKIKETKAALDEFEGLLYDHLLKEKTSFYIYLRGIFSEDEGTLELVNHFSREMDGIQREVMKFLRKYKESDLSSDELREMNNELSDLGKALTGRIKREESQLYPLYMPPPAVSQ